MTLVRYNPLSNFVPSTFGDFVESVLNNSTSSSPSPAVDIIKHEKKFELQLIAPGMKREQFGIDVDNNVLTVSGERNKNEEVRENYLQTESRFGSFERSFRLNDNIKQDGIKAKYEDGILIIELPISKKVETKKVIDVK